MRPRASSLLLASLALWAAGPARCGESGEQATPCPDATGDGRIDVADLMLVGAAGRPDAGASFPIIISLCHPPATSCPRS